MAKSFKDVVEDSPRTGLGVSVKTKNPLSNKSFFHFIKYFSENLENTMEDSMGSFSMLSRLELVLSDGVWKNKHYFV